MARFIEGRGANAKARFVEGGGRTNAKACFTQGGTNVKACFIKQGGQIC